MRSKNAEFINPNAVPVNLTGPNGEKITVQPKTKIVLPEFFIKFSPRQIKFIKFIREDTVIRRAVALPKQSVTNRPITEKINRAIREQRKTQSIKSGVERKPHKRTSRVVRANTNKIWKSRTVGKSVSAGSQRQFSQVVSQSIVPISNDIGVGILSYNRFGSLRRLIESIEAYTDLNKTTVFVSDESSNFTPDQINWLKLRNIVLLRGQRIGVAGNTNRLLQCLSRFKYKFLLNDDVEIINKGWEHFYVNAMQKSGLHHFCLRQNGVYGASNEDWKQHSVRGIQIRTVGTKPHGGVLVFDEEAFKAVGYFDENFGLYGMEHVDWSERIGKFFNSPGYHDAVGSNEYMVLHDETSAVPSRVQELHKAREYYDKVKGTRTFVAHSEQSKIPALSVIIPYRNTERSRSMRTVIANMRAQRIPNLEIIVVEQDAVKRVDQSVIEPVNYYFVPNTPPHSAFNKAQAFNKGVSEASNELIVLQDADIIATGNYLAEIYATLQTHTGCHLGEHVYYLSQNSTNVINDTNVLSPEYDCVRVVNYFEGGSLGVHKKTYADIGGFNENFVGYGVEDCCFYKRLIDMSKFANNRKFKFFHLYHGRTPGWDGFHDMNRKYYGDILKKYPGSKEYCSMLSEQFKRKYSRA